MNNFFGFGNAQSPQLMQGLLGSTDEQNHDLEEVIASGVSKAAQLGQLAQNINPATGNDFLAQRQNSAQQFAQQALAQQQQQDAQNQGLLLSLAAKFLGGGF